MAKKQFYLNNKKLKGEGVSIEFTPEQAVELAKCAKDPVYFAKKWVKIVSLDSGAGIVGFDCMWDYQENIIRQCDRNRFNIIMMPRQYGKSISIVSFILHQIIFKDHHAVAIFANKKFASKKDIQKLKIAYENLPFWIQQGVVEWNKESIKLENGSTVEAGATSESSGRSGSYNLVLLDEFALVQKNVADEFMRAAYPTITSGKSSKIIVVSTAKGMNQFYKLWKDATSIPKKNNYVPLEVKWSDMPGRDEQWKQEQIFGLGSEEAFNQEFGNQFFGDTSSTLISPLKLKRMDYLSPIFSENNLDIFKQPKLEHSYVMCVDTAHGVGADYSAFLVIDVTHPIQEVVAKYKNNLISPLVYPIIVHDVAKKYNNAFVLVETNDVGCQVADALNYEFEYENLFSSVSDRYVGTYKALMGTYQRKAKAGVRTTKTVKNIGCSTLKTLIENDKLILNDFDIISEFTTFISQGSSYAAESGSYDDLVMCLVLFV